MDKNKYTPSLAPLSQQESLNKDSDKEEKLPMYSLQDAELLILLDRLKSNLEGRGVDVDAFLEKRGEK